MPRDLLSVGDIASLPELGGIAPRLISDLIYSGKVPRDRLVRAGGIWLVPRSLVPVIVKALRETGRLPATDARNQAKG